MKIFEIQLRNGDDEVVYKTLVPEIHVQDKVDTLIGMNKIAEISGINIVEMGDISDRYIQSFSINPQMKGASRFEITRNQTLDAQKGEEDQEGEMSLKEKIG